MSIGRRTVRDHTMVDLGNGVCCGLWLEFRAVLICLFLLQGAWWDMRKVDSGQREDGSAE
jgi:hypothetical protein